MQQIIKEFVLHRILKFALPSTNLARNLQGLYLIIVTQWIFDIFV